MRRVDSLSPAQIERFSKYMDMLLEWNARLNLTAITDKDDIILKHFEDSLSIAPYIERRGDKPLTVVDVGSGAGFPGIPVAIAMDNVSVTLIESISKKAAFLNAVIERLGLTNARVICGRAEEMAKEGAMRESADIACARAVAPMPALSELCLPLVKVGGLFLAMKGAEAHKEAEAAAPIIKALGGGEARVRRADIGENINHSIVIIEKTGRTPERFPRRPSRIGTG